LLKRFKCGQRGVTGERNTKNVRLPPVKLKHQRHRAQV